MATELIEIGSGFERSDEVTVAADAKVTFTMTWAGNFAPKGKSRIRIELKQADGSPRIVDTLTPERNSLQLDSQPEEVVYTVSRPADAGAIGCDRIGGSVA